MPVRGRTVIGRSLRRGMGQVEPTVDADGIVLMRALSSSNHGFAYLGDSSFVAFIIVSRALIGWHGSKMKDTARRQRFIEVWSGDVSRPSCMFPGLDTAFRKDSEAGTTKCPCPPAQAAPRDSKSPSSSDELGELLANLFSGAYPSWSFHTAFAPLSPRYRHVNRKV